MRRILALNSIFLSFLLWANVFSQNEPAVGTITFIEGIADLSRYGEEAKTLKEDQAVYVNDRIRTKTHSKLEITFLDKSVLKLAPSTCIQVEEFRLDYRSRREHAEIKLKRGKLEAIVSKTGKPETFVIQTPNSRGAVRGSDIFMSYLAGKTGVFVNEGAISVYNPALPAVKTNLTTGDCVYVPFNEAPGSVRPALGAELALHKRDVQPELIRKWIPTKNSEEMNAVIVSLSGTVRIFQRGMDDFQAAKQDDFLSEGDKLQTGEDGQAKITFNNGNSLLLEANTELIFTTLRYDPISGDYENTLEMSRGKVSGVVEKINKKSTFQVKTPTAICGVRGTFLQIAITPPPVSITGPTIQPPQTHVFFEGGGGVVSSLLTGQSQAVGAGQNVRVDVRGNVSAPVFTPMVQSTAMTQNWTEVQTASTYSSGQVATGVDGSVSGEILPPPPEMLVKEPLHNPLGDELKLKDSLPDIPFSQIHKTSLVYHGRMPANPGLSHPSIVAPSTILDVALKDNHRWKAYINGNYAGSPVDPHVHFTNPNTNLRFNITGTLLSSASGTFNIALSSGSNKITGIGPTKTLTLTDVKEAHYDHGTLIADVGGKW